MLLKLNEFIRYLAEPIRELFLIWECIIVCVKAKFVDVVQARFGHPIGGIIPTWQNEK